jgi:Ni/Fe-hydrogenase subunit HybB-like protein
MGALNALSFTLATSYNIFLKNLHILNAHVIYITDHPGQGGNTNMTFFTNGQRYRSRLLAYSMAFCAVFITIAMVQYPKPTFDAAIMGLNLWWNVVFPSLLPFFILSEILMGLGVVHFIGVLLEPLMRPVFNVPGIGAFATTTIWI